MTLNEEYKKAPDAEVTLSNGTSHYLREFWKEKPLFLVFLRHFG